MKAKCNKCNKTVEINDNEVPTYQDKDVLVYDQNPCHPGFKTFQKVDKIPVMQVSEKEKLHFKCSCGKEGFVYTRAEVLYKNGLTKCCGKLNTYTLKYIEIPKHQFMVPDRHYLKDLYGSGNSN